jgi:hypothetical protein
MYSRAHYRRATVSQLVAWIVSVCANGRSMHKANDIAAVAALSGDPPGA